MHGIKHFQLHLGHPITMPIRHIVILHKEFSLRPVPSHRQRLWLVRTVRMIKLIDHLGRLGPSPGKDAMHLAFRRLTGAARAMPVTFWNVAQRRHQATQMVRRWTGFAANEVATVAAFSAKLLMLVFLLGCFLCNFKNFLDYSKYTHVGQLGTVYVILVKTKNMIMLDT